MLVNTSAGDGKRVVSYALDISGIFQSERVDLEFALTLHYACSLLAPRVLLTARAKPPRWWEAQRHPTWARLWSLSL